MKIDLMPSAVDIDTDKLDGATAVVIDVLRATTVMVTAFANGLDRLITVASPNEAFALKEQFPSFLLGGEKDAVYVPGFDLDNSPFNYTPERVTGKTLVMSTSNGTRAIKGSLNAKKLLIGSFLNAKAVVDAIKNDEKVILVCSGSNNTFTLEDALCAGYMAWLLRQVVSEVEMSDFAISMEQLYISNQHNIHALAEKGNHYKLLKRKGFEIDLDYCFTPDTHSIVPVFHKGVFVVTPSIS